MCPTVPLALGQVSLTLIRKFARKSARYMDAYRKGLTGKAAEYAIKKYHSHRRVPLSTGEGRNGGAVRIVICAPLLCFQPCDCYSKN